jgi:hypothetical protein
VGPTQAVAPAPSEAVALKPAAQGDGWLPDEYASSIPPAHVPVGEQPRIIEEHHIVGPHGEDEIEATDERGRRWYHLRPEPRRRVEFVGLTTHGGW